MADPTNHKFASGATSSTEKPRYDLIPVTALKRLAERFGYGAKKHGDHNYKSGHSDPAFVRDRMNHMIEHAQKYATGDRSTDHLGAVMCNAAMLAEMERLAADKEVERQFGTDLGPGAMVEVPGPRGTWEEGKPPVDRAERDYQSFATCSNQHQPSGFRCTRGRGHSGDHVAHYSPTRVCARWEATK